jgi:hypothetical protein
LHLALKTGEVRYAAVVEPVEPFVDTRDALGTTTSEKPLVKLERVDSRVIPATV